MALSGARLAVLIHIPTGFGVELRSASAGAESVWAPSVLAVVNGDARNAHAADGVDQLVLQRVGSSRGDSVRRLGSRAAAALGCTHDSSSSPSVFKMGQSAARPCRGQAICTRRSPRPIAAVNT